MSRTHFPGFCFILKFCRRRGGSEAQKPPAGYFFGRGTAVDVDAAGKGPLPSIDPVVYPLHCPSNRDRPKFAVGVFLLNKDVIQLLQAHGVSSFGPNQLLQNLHKLVACAESALPQGLTSAQWRW